MNITLISRVKYCECYFIEIMKYVLVFRKSTKARESYSSGWTTLRLSYQVETTYLYIRVSAEWKNPGYKQCSKKSTCNLGANCVFTRCLNINCVFTRGLNINCVFTRGLNIIRWRYIAKIARKINICLSSSSLWNIVD